MERLLAIAIFVFWLPIEASANLGDRLGGTYGTCAREGELEMIRVALPGVNAADLERLVYAFRNQIPQANHCHCPTISPAVLTDLETSIERVLGIMLDDPDGFTPAETQRITAVISACETREKSVFDASLKISRGVYSNAIPQGFSLYQNQRFTDPSGLEGYILKKNGTNPEELTIAFSGTEDGTDVVSDLLFKGGNQYRAAVAKLMDTMVQAMSQGKKVTCTGHSLGGGVAQGFCATLLARMQGRDPSFSTRQADNRLRVVTFGSLGGSSMVANEASIRTTWFASNNTHFVVNGDVIPRIDPPTCGQIRSLGRLANPADAHDLGTFERFAANGWSSVKQGFQRIDQAAINLFNGAREGLRNMWRGLRSITN